MALTETEMDRLRDLTVRVLDAARRDALSAGTLVSLKQYDRIASVLRIEARTSATVAEWATGLHRRMGLSSPSRTLSFEVLDMDAAVAEMVDGPRGRDVVTAELMTMMEREHGYLIARLRLMADDRRRAANREEATA